MGDNVVIRSFRSVLAALPHEIAVLAAMLLFMPAALATTIATLEVSTTQRWANTTIDHDNSKIWNFLVQDGITIEDIVRSLVLKEGQSTTGVGLACISGPRPFGRSLTKACPS